MPKTYISIEYLIKIIETYIQKTDFETILICKQIIHKYYETKRLDQELTEKLIL